jgi:hypothetical protein
MYPEPEFVNFEGAQESIPPVYAAWGPIRQIGLGTVLAGRAGPKVAALLNNLVHLGGLVASVPTFKALPRFPIVILSVFLTQFLRRQ